MLEQHRLRLLIALVLPALMAVAGLWALLQLPAGTLVPIHFNAAGQANGWAEAIWGLFLLPLLSVGTLGLILLPPWIDPRAEKLRQSQRAQLNIALALQLLLATVQALIIAIAMGQQPDFNRWLLLMTGFLFSVIGNMAGKLRWNYTVGIRTPWTLADERVWDKTHRFGGLVFLIAGLALIGAALLSVPSSLGLPLIVAASLISTALCVGKSWWLWRQQVQHG